MKEKVKTLNYFLCHYNNIIIILKTHLGATGLGKSTMVNTLFKGRLSRISSTGTAAAIPKTVEVKSVSHGPVLLFLPVTCAEMQEHKLRPIDVEFMKRLDKCVNIVPVIAKADTLTIEEREAFRRRLREDIQKNNINIYPILGRQDLDEEEARTTSRIREQLPFAVIGSDRYVTVSGKPVLGRKTKWGLIEVENKNHCEFAQLRDMLIKTHMQDLKEVTDSIHYESYRRKRLTEERNSTEIVLTNGVVNMDCQESKI
ncbi:Neuronal-specific septin-3 [Acropora cervicornis]|uniref:Neuronal-specific septin-3 n=1 Tax=Acropora cervicornis TaxID=6130 RepID=A0AAD9R2M6_ACRCE|nr:Neuronal-specific septin-3 [Acropora cervicornis]